VTSAIEPGCVREIVASALACGAREIGGPLSGREEALARACGAASPSSVRRLRSAIRDGDDPLGNSYVQTLGVDARRRAGTYYTSGAIVDAMVGWAFERHVDRFIDPGCGSGRFSVAAVKRDRGIAVVAIDSDPVATLIARASLAAMGARRARVLNGDYLTARIPRIDGRSAFVGNPPYVRHHRLASATKRRGAALAMRLGYRVSALAGLHALFYLATLAKHGRNGDVGSFVTSAEWLDTRYGSILREIFVNGLGGSALALFDAQARPFDDAMTTAAIATFELGRNEPSARIARIADARVDLSAGVALPRSTLAASQRWSELTRGTRTVKSRQRLGSLFRVSRGQVTGANDFFVMPRERARARGIERFCVPVIASAKEIFGCGGVLRDDGERFVALEIGSETRIHEHEHLLAYLREGEAAGIHARYVSGKRRPWYCVRYPRPPAVATYMARQPPCFALNPDGLGLLNIAHGLYPRSAMSERELHEAIERLNSARYGFAGGGRTYHGGLEKFEPREMENLALPRRLSGGAPRTAQRDGFIRSE
jgi:adenine-specific DNA-methyltransferase